MTATPAGVLAVLPRAAGTGPGIGRRAAQRLARTELSKRIYHPSVSLTERVLHALLGYLGDVYRAATGLPGGWWTLVALIALVVALVSGVLAWAGPVARTRRARQAMVPPGQPLRARDHRRAAGARAEAGDYATAICEYVRAIAAELDERGVLAPRGGRTADEFAEEASRALPPHAHGLREAARSFDEICYGKREGTREGCDRLRDLDDRIRVASPARQAGAPPAVAPVGSGVP